MTQWLGQFIGFKAKLFSWSAVLSFSGSTSSSSSSVHTRYMFSL